MQREGQHISLDKNFKITIPMLFYYGTLLPFSGDNTILKDFTADLKKSIIETAQEINDAIGKQNFSKVAELTVSFRQLCLDNKFHTR